MGRVADEPHVENSPTASQAAENAAERPEVPSSTSLPDEPGGDGGIGGHPEQVGSPNRHRLRRGLVWLLAFLAALSIVGFTIILWAHQVALNTNRFATVLAPLAADPAVTGAVSDAMSGQVVDALDLEARLGQSLPARLSVLAAPLTGAAQDLVRRQLSNMMSDASFPQLWDSAIRRVHALLVRALRDDPRNPSVSFADGKVTLDMLGLAASVLQTQQANGASPPALNPKAAPEDTRSRLEGLGINVPDGFGQVVLLESNRLAKAQQAVRLFDRSIWAILGLALAFVAAAVALSLDRRRTVIAIGASTALLSLLAVLMLPYLTGSAISSLTTGPGRVIVEAVLALAQGSLLSFLAVTLSLGILAALVAHLAGRPRWLSAANAAVKRS